MADIERTQLAQQEFDHWAADAELVAEEAERQITSQKAFLAAEEALTEFDQYLSTLPIEAHETALRGIREYADAILHEQEIEVGYTRFTG